MRAPAILFTAIAGVHAQGGRGRGPQAPPNIAGAWIGTGERVCWLTQAM